MFVHTEDGYVRIASIVRARINYSTGRVSLTYDGGAGRETTTCNLVQWDHTLRNTVQALIPAAAGTALLSPWIRDDDTFQVSRTSVIAWAQCADGELRPVTPDGVNDGLDVLEAVVSLPGAEVVRFGDSSWRTYDDWAVEAEAEERQQPPEPVSGAQSIESAALALAEREGE